MNINELTEQQKTALFKCGSIDELAELCGKAGISSTITLSLTDTLNSTEHGHVHCRDVDII